MSAPVRVAVVGTGTTARIHVEALLALDEPVEIVAGVGDDAGQPGTPPVAGLAGTGPALAAGLAGTGPALAAALDEIGPALVCTSEIGAALTALAGGMHAVVEPSSGLSLRGLDDLDAAQSPGGPYAAMMFPHRFGSGVRRLRALAADGVFGRPLLAVCHTLGKSDGPTVGPGIDQIDVLTCVLGEWTEIEAVAHRLARPRRAEDVSLAHVTFAGGAVASVVNSALSPRAESYLRFDFERATVEVTHVRGYGDDDWRVTPAPGHESTVLPAWKAGEHGRRSGHDAQFATVLAALRGGTAPPVSPAAARATMLFVAGMYASAFTGGPVVPGDLEPGSAFYERMDGFGPPWRP